MVPDNTRFMYLDHSSTTPVRAEALEAMLPFFGEEYGNPSSIHRAGRRALAALTMARRTIAATFGATSEEIVFTGSGSEGANMALRGIALARRETTGANRIVISAIEHKAVVATAEQLRDHFGFNLTILPVDGDGIVHPQILEEALSTGDAAVVSIHYANNEIGVIQPIGELAAIARAQGVPFHTDAVQAAGRLSLDVHALGVDALSIAAHKFYGPKGVGALWLRSGTPFLPMMTGGSHEGGRRAGTENVPLIVGMATALALAEAERVAEVNRLVLLRDQLIDGVLQKIAGASLTGSHLQRLPHHASFLFAGVEAEGVLIALDMAGIAASSGSACTSAAHQPSHVLIALGVSPQDAAGGLRLTMGRATDAEVVERVLQVLPGIVEKMRTTSHGT
jgi:cysteine desulfurase